GTTLTLTLDSAQSNGSWTKSYDLAPLVNPDGSYGGGYGEIADDDVLPVPPERPTCGCGSETPVQGADGTALMSATDLMSDAGGTPWGVTRDWTSNAGFDRGNAFGSGTSVNQQPYLAWRETPQAAATLDLIDQQVEEKLAVVMDAHTAYYFDDLDHDGV